MDICIAQSFYLHSFCNNSIPLFPSRDGVVVTHLAFDARVVEQQPGEAAMLGPRPSNSCPPLRECQGSRAHQGDPLQEYDYWCPKGGLAE